MKFSKEAKFLYNCSDKVLQGFCRNVVVKYKSLSLRMLRETKKAQQKT